MNFLERSWYNKAPWLYLLWPLSLCFTLLIHWRRRWLTPAGKRIEQSPPVIVVGNITVGGTGKTPLIMTLVGALQKAGFHPGVISRGYGASSAHYPLAVTANSETGEAGDEPVLIASECDCPVVVDPDRPRALDYLVKNYPIDVVLSDDGLQHYRLHRDMEIIVVDGARLFGNGLCLPAGPLREPVVRLREAQAIVLNGDGPRKLPELKRAFVMRLAPVALVNLSTNERLPFGGAPFKMGNTVQAVAALGNPQRFFSMLEKLPYPLRTFSFPDHMQLTPEALEAAGVDMHHPIVMTGKDGIKCQQFADANWWTLEVSVNLPKALLDSVTDHVAALQR